MQTPEQVNWEKIRIEDKDRLYELYHENSKRTIHSSLELKPRKNKSWQESLKPFIPSPRSYPFQIKTLNDRLKLGKIFIHIEGIIPIEVWLHIPENNDIESGLYHYSHEGLASLINNELSEHLHPSDISIIFTCIFEKMTTPFEERGYRRALIKCGQILQNMSTYHNRSMLIYEDYSDYDIEEYMMIDGVYHSLIEVYTMNPIQPNTL